MQSLASQRCSTAPSVSRRRVTVRALRVAPAPWHLAPSSTSRSTGNTATCSPRRHAWSPSATPARQVACSASASAAVPAASPAETPSSSWKLPVYIVLWYAFNMIFNIVNKTGLNAFPCPWFIGTFQLAASGLFMALLWITKLQPVPRVTLPLFLALLPVALFHTVGHISAVVSFSQMAVSFTHVVKSAEPVFSVLLSWPLLGQTYPAYVWLSLLPIVAGCSMSAMKEVSFAWAGFNNAMVSNLGMVLRNILSKKALADYKEVDGINLFGLLSIVSLLYCAPAAVVMEGAKWGPALAAASAKLGQTEFYQLLAVGGLFYHLYNQLSYMVLDEGISPVTFSVGNTMKRVAVVVSSVAFFRNPVAPLNWVGTSIAILGTYLYSLASDKFNNEKKAKAAAAKAAEAAAADPVAEAGAASEE